MKAVDSASNLIRAVVSLVIVGIVGFAGFIGYSIYDEARQAEQAMLELQDTKEKLRQAHADLVLVSEKLEMTETALRLMKVDRRVATITVDDKRYVDGQTLMDLTFTEYGRDGNPAGESKKFKLEGDTFYVSGLVAKFDDKYVEAGDELRGASICMLQSIYGENQPPAEGFPIDERGARPIAYDNNEPLSDFEEKIWNDFWQYANNPDKAGEIGLRAASGEAPFIQAEKGKTYELELRASAGLTLRPKRDESAH